MGLGFGCSFILEVPLALVESLTLIIVGAREKVSSVADVLFHMGWLHFLHMHYCLNCTNIFF